MDTNTILGNALIANQAIIKIMSTQRQIKSEVTELLLALDPSRESPNYAIALRRAKRIAELLGMQGE